MDAKEIVDRYYYDPREPNSFGGLTRFSAKFPDIDKKDLLEVLQGEEAYTLHKPIRKRFPTRKTVAHTLDAVWQMDLTDMIKYATYNDGYRYILFVIDVFSRYLWMKPMKNKRPETVADAVREVMNDDERVPSLIHTDRGTEFVGKPFQDLVLEYNMSYFNTFSINKAAIVERVQRTIKERMHRYFTKMNTFRYIDILQDLAYSYNRSYHRTIKTTPIEMVETKPVIPPRLKQKIKDNTGIKEGDYVRVSRSDNKFRKGFEPGWSKEVFKVRFIKDFPKDGMNLYYLTDLDDENIQGGFYKQEIQKVKFDPETHIYKIEKIIGSKGKGRNKQYLVKWLGYPDKFNSYINASDVNKYKSV